jgi:anti-sigma B factor antagonist
VFTVSVVDRPVVDRQRLAIELHPAAFGVVVSLIGELDLGTVSLFRQWTSELLARAGPLYVLLDMTGLALCDSSGLGALIGLWRHVTDGTGILALAGVHGRTARLLAVTAMGHTFSQYGSRDEAITALIAAQPLLPASPRAGEVTGEEAL